MFNELDDDTHRRGRQLERLQHRRRPADAVQVRRQLRRAHARLPVAPLPLHPDHDAEGRRRQPAVRHRRCRPRSSSRPSNIGTAFRFNEETRPIDAYDGDQTTTSGYGMVDIALSARTRLIAGARVERFDQTVNTLRSVRAVRARRSGRRTRTPTSSRRSTSCRRSAPNSNIRLSYSTTVNRPEFRELAEFEFTDVVGNRAVKGNPDLKRALIQNVDGRWEMFTRRPRHPRGERLLQVLRQADRARRHRRRASRSSTFQNADHAQQLRHRAGGRRTSSAEDFFVNANYTFVDSKITLLPEQRTRADVARAAARRASRRTCST